MKLTHYFALAALMSAPLCNAQETTTTGKLLAKGAADAGLALVAGYVAWQSAKTAVNEMDECLTEYERHYNSKYSLTKGNVVKSLTTSYDDNYGFQGVRPLAYLSLLWLTGTTAITRTLSACRNFKAAYDQKMRKVSASTVKPEAVKNQK